MRLITLRMQQRTHFDLGGIYIYLFLFCFLFWKITEIQIKLNLHVPSIKPVSRPFWFHFLHLSPGHQSPQYSPVAFLLNDAANPGRRDEVHDTNDHDISGHQPPCQDERTLACCH